ncbi:hypothetical protein QCA50_016585 [Cerrena zonata]|uniref:Uncharacterized protein n=1 Tax=Cerrena zonata TaxID=2478898 RepID=A0AAW0FMW5_9APHY
MPAWTSLVFVLFGTSASLTALANPVVIRDSPITLSVAKRFNATGVANILQTDQARAHSIRKNVQAKGQNLESRTPGYSRCCSVWYPKHKLCGGLCG